MTLTRAQVATLHTEMTDAEAIDARLEQTNITGTIHATLLGSWHIEVGHVLIGEGGAVVRRGS